jgi:hypothetical protein
MSEFRANPRRKTRQAVRMLALALGMFVVFVPALSPGTPAPDQVTPIPSQRADEAGANAVNAQTGAATYGYAFTMPPARGMGPSLSLNYSSNGPIRGTIAHGWTLDSLPLIRRNVRLEAPGAVTHVYEANLGGHTDTLVQVTDPAAEPGASAFRAKYDQAFTRYEKTSTGA